MYWAVALEILISPCIRHVYMYYVYTHTLRYLYSCIDKHGCDDALRIQAVLIFGFNVYWRVVSYLLFLNRRTACFAVANARCSILNVHNFCPFCYFTLIETSVQRASVDIA